MDDSERKDNACTKNHENFCGQAPLPVLRAHYFDIEQAAPYGDLMLPTAARPLSRPERVTSQDALLTCLLKLALRNWSSSWYNTTEFFGTHAIVKQVRSSQMRRLSQCFDLPINQLVNFTFDGGGRVSHHTVPSREL